jgi:cell growth-regulating nucleolar protein
MDCMKRFTDSSYRAHTSCISEAQKYQGALYKPPKAKGARGEGQQAKKEPASPKTEEKKATTPAPAATEEKKKRKRSDKATPESEPEPEPEAAPEPTPEPEPAPEPKKPKKKKAKRIPEALVEAIKTEVDQAMAAQADPAGLRAEILAKLELALDEAIKRSQQQQQ